MASLAADTSARREVAEAIMNLRYSENDYGHFTSHRLVRALLGTLGLALDSTGRPCQCPKL